MERIYLVTPEMQGLTWQLLIRRALLRGGLYLMTAILCSALPNGNWMRSIATALVAAAIDFALMLSSRFHTPKRLRVTDMSIEEIDGPIIRKDELISLNERTNGELEGIEVVGRRSPSWLPKYRIFIPALVDGFTELRQSLQSWGAYKNEC